MAPKLIQCIKFSFSLTAGARFRWINNKSVPHSSSVFACRRGKNTCAPSIVYRLLIGWNCHTTWSQGNLHYMRLHFLKLDREFFCLQPSLARLYCAAASPSERGSLAIIGHDPFNRNFWKFWSKTQWIHWVQLEKFRKNWSTFWGPPLLPVGPVRILVAWIVPVMWAWLKQ